VNAPRPSAAAPADRPGPARSVPVRVLENAPAKGEIHEIVLLAPAGWGPVHAGQFIQLECPPRELFGLRRPFSLSGCRERPDGVELRIVYGAIGQRTRALAAVRAGAELEMVGPLGRPFSLPAGRRPVMIGGGRGIAPVLMLARQWCGGRPDALLLYGARTAAQLLPLGPVPCELLTATEDGSAGFRGTLLDLLERLRAGGRIREGEDALFACGPNAMLAALASWVEGRDLPCEVSLETQFGCGTGICAGCAVPVRGRPAARGAGQEVPHESGHGSGQVGSQDTGGGRPATDFDRYVFACREGPVFPAEIVEWEGLHE